MKQTPNSRRLNERAREVIASIMLDEIADPRLDLVTVTGAEVSPDRSVVAVYVSTEPARYDSVLAGLESAKGRLRSLLGRALGWRVSPELRFFIDTSIDTGMRITEALKDVPPSLAAEARAGASDPAEGEAES
ncbi:MAG: 30S ribosome-binding factor RbfA [Coriobacteriia bacterium]